MTKKPADMKHKREAQATLLFAVDSHAAKKVSALCGRTLRSFQRFLRRRRSKLLALPSCNRT
jgi:transposase